MSESEGASINSLLTRLNNLRPKQLVAQKANQLNKSKFEDESYEDSCLDDGNRRLNFMRMPNYNSVQSCTENFKTIRPANRELSQYSAEALFNTPGEHFKSMADIHFKFVWNKLLEQETVNKPTLNYFTTTPSL